jgi:hypothetical protein
VQYNSTKHILVANKWAELHTKFNIRNVYVLLEYAHWKLSIVDVVYVVMKKGIYDFALKKASLSIHMVVEFFFSLQGQDEGRK